MTAVNLIQIPDVIPKLYQEHLENELSSSAMEWNFQEEAARSASKFEQNFSGFSHTAYLTAMDSAPPVMTSLTSLLLPVLYMFCDKAGLEYNHLLRIRVGLFPRTTVPVKHHNPHVDFSQPHHTCVYYVNDCDGSTTVFNETIDDISLDDCAKFANKGKFTVAARSAPKKGKMIGFDGRHYHASMHPIKAVKRIAITYNFV